MSPFVPPVQRKPVGLSCPPTARRKQGRDIFLGAGSSGFTGLHVPPDPSQPPPPAAAARFLPLRRGAPAAPVCRWLHQDCLCVGCFHAEWQCYSSQIAPVPAGVTGFYLFHVSLTTCANNYLSLYHGSRPQRRREKSHFLERSASCSFLVYLSYLPKLLEISTLYSLLQ